MTATAALAALVAVVKRTGCVCHPPIRMDDGPHGWTCEGLHGDALAQAQAVLATPQEQTTERLETLNVALSEQLVAADEAVSSLVVDVPCRVCGAKPVVPPFPWCREHVFNQGDPAMSRVLSSASPEDALKEDFLAERVFRALVREGSVNPLDADHLLPLILRAIQETPRCG